MKAPVAACFAPCLLLAAAASPAPAAPPAPVAAATAPGAAALEPGQVAAIDKAVSDILAAQKVPSAQVAVVRGGVVVLAKSWGKAGEGMAASPDQPYQIASNSKQFLAALILKLRDEGRLSLDDTVAKWLPGVTGGDTITIRQLLSHTSGLRDYWPQDYMFSDMTQPISPQQIVARWASRPLDYTPGTRYQYSNTGYVVAGLIAEKAGGAPLWDQLETAFFKPLGIHPHKLDDTNRAGFPQGYHRYALGPAVPATPPAPGWLWAAGELSMTASELARWDIARLERKLLPARDWEEQETPIVLADGTTSGYGLGVYSSVKDGRHVVDHGGESVGFLSQNSVYPDSGVAIVVLTNADFGSVTGPVTKAVADIVMPRDNAGIVDEPARLEDATATFADFVAGRYDAGKFTEHARFYFDDAVRRDYAQSLAPVCQDPKVTARGAPSLRGGYVYRGFGIACGTVKLYLATYAEPGAKGRWEQFLVSPAE